MFFIYTVEQKAFQRTVDKIGGAGRHGRRKFTQVVRHYHPERRVSANAFYAPTFHYGGLPDSHFVACGGGRFKQFRKSSVVLLVFVK